MDQEKELLENVLECLININAELFVLSKNIRKEECFDEFLEFVDSLQDIRKAFDYTVEIHKMPYERYDFSDLLSDMLVGFENRDYSLVGDVLENGFSVKIKDWIKVLQEVV